MAKEEKSKTARKKHPSMKKGEYYKIDGEGLKRKKSCPKCGAGTFLAEHEKRLHCGNCKYTEFK